MPRQAESVGDVLSRLLQDLGWGRRVFETRALGLWKGVVGEPLATHTTPLSVKGGKIVVAVKDPVWKQEIHLLRAEIIRKLNEKMESEVISDIVLVIR